MSSLSGSSIRRVILIHYYGLLKTLHLNHPYTAEVNLATERGLTGTMADFPALLFGHSITFLNVQLHDDGDYYCCVSYWSQDGTYNQGESLDITLTVQGKFIC